MQLIFYVIEQISPQDNKTAGIFVIVVCIKHGNMLKGGCASANSGGNGIAYIKDANRELEFEGRHR